MALRVSTVVPALWIAFDLSTARAENAAASTKPTQSNVQASGATLTSQPRPNSTIGSSLPMGVEAISPPPRVASTGFFAEGGLGAVAFLPKASRSAAVGPALSLRLGVDLWSWFSVGLVVAASNHEATVPPPPSGEWFQLYRGGGDARLGFRLERIAVFVEGGAGIAVVSSNVLEKATILDPGEKISIAFHGGAGLEYQLENRHYAFGLGVDAFLLPQFTAPSGPTAAIDSRLYVRYTHGD